MLVEIFKHIRLQSTQKTVTELCFDSNDRTNPNFIQSDIKMIDFDALAKKVGKTVCSPDGLALSKNIIHFVEFKNKGWDNIRISDTSNREDNLYLKVYDGISVFGFYSNIDIKNDVDITFTIILNPKKNTELIKKLKEREEDPMAGAFDELLEENNVSPVTRIDLVKYKKMKDGKLHFMKKLFNGLSKFGITVKVDVLLIQEEIDEFLSQFIPTYFFRAKIKVPYLF